MHAFIQTKKNFQTFCIIEPILIKIDNKIDKNGILYIECALGSLLSIIALHRRGKCSYN